jgi:molybdopterin molybdotransferase
VLVPLDEARAHVLGVVASPLDSELVDAADAVGRVLAESVTAAEAVPGFDNSAMDGYAVSAPDTEAATAVDPVHLQEAGRVLAGQRHEGELAAGFAVRIMTGAPLPVGADAVVPIEEVTVEGDDVVVSAPVPAGRHVRHAGDDVRPGDVVAHAGAEVSPALLGVLATLGVDKVSVHRRPRVGVLSTGDELVAGSGPLRAGEIRDSNRPMLLALVAAAGAEPVDLGHSPDDEEQLTEAIVRGVGSCDAVLTSGGVSMGDVDLVRVVLDTVGEMRWMQVAVKPAKPFAFGVVADVPVFGLPGNPVSSAVSFELFARPAIRRLAGHPDGRLDRPCPVATAVDGLERQPDGKVHLVRVSTSTSASGELEVRSAGGQGSHQLATLAASDALAILPDGPGVPAGGAVRVLLLGDR